MITYWEVEVHLHVFLTARTDFMFRLCHSPCVLQNRIRSAAMGVHEVTPRMARDRRVCSDAKHAAAHEHVWSETERPATVGKQFVSQYENPNKKL